MLAAQELRPKLASSCSKVESFDASSLGDRNCSILELQDLEVTEIPNQPLDSDFLLDCLSTDLLVAPYHTEDEGRETPLLDRDQFYHNN